MVSAVYYFCVHPYILDALDWLSRNLAFSFVIGYFFGVFTIDLLYSAKLLSRIRKFAAEHEVVIKVENLKAHIRQRQEERLSGQAATEKAAAEKRAVELLGADSLETAVEGLPAAQMETTAARETPCA